MERRLSAILAVDVVSYSRLMERDEAGTFERLRAHRKDLFEPEIAAHHGRIFKLTGDGLLAEFGSVVDAVECAVLLQRAMAERNNGLADGQRIDVRMGLHVGDVIIEGDDRHGDAVNIAARLQQIAESGGICVSGAAVDHLRHKVALRFEPRGQERLKNIAEPVTVYRVALGESPPRRKVSDHRPAKWVAAAAVFLLLIAGGIATALYGIPSIQAPLPPASDQGIPVIVVLPFKDMTGNQAIADAIDLSKVGLGIAEELITDLSTFPEFKVLSSTTSFAYANKPIPEIVTATGATFIVEGSIRRSGENALVTTQLISGTTDTHLKSIQIEERLADSVTLQMQIVMKIRDQLGGVFGMFRQELRRIAENKAESDFTEYDYYLVGYIHIHRSKRTEVERSGEIWRQGLQHYPNSALLRCKLSFLETWFRRNEAASKLIDEAKVQKRKSRLDEWCIHYAQATVSMYAGQRRQAASEARKVLDMAPYDTMAHADMAWVLRNSGLYQEAVDAMTFAITHDPAPREWYFYDLVRMHQAAGQMKELVLLAEAGVQNNARYAKWWYDVLGSAYKNLGEREKAEAAWKKASTLPDPPEL